PGESLGEAARTGTQGGHQRRRLGQLEHPAGQALDVAVRHQKSRLAVEHRVAEPGTVRGDRWRAARARYDHRDTPTFLGRREDVRPRPPEERDLLRLTDEAVK